MSCDLMVADSEGVKDVWSMFDGGILRTHQEGRETLDFISAMLLPRL